MRRIVVSAVVLLHVQAIEVECARLEERFHKAACWLVVRPLLLALLPLLLVRYLWRGVWRSRLERLVVQLVPLVGRLPPLPQHVAQLTRPPPVAAAQSLLLADSVRLRDEEREVAPRALRTPSWHRSFKPSPVPCIQLPLVLLVASLIAGRDGV